MIYSNFRGTPNSPTFVKDGTANFYGWITQDPFHITELEKLLSELDSYSKNQREVLSSPQAGMITKDFQFILT